MQLSLPPFGWDLAKEAAKYLVVAAAGWVLNSGKRWWGTRPARAFWHPFISDDLRLVVGHFEQFRLFERSGVIGVGDAIALGELQRYLAQIGARDPKVVYDNRLEGDDLKHTIIALGGPDANEVTRGAVKQIDSKLRFGDPEVDKNAIVIRDTTSDPPRLYNPDPLDRDGAGTDFGLILRAPNPYAPEKEMMIIAGSFGHGTWAATRYVISPAFLALREAKAQGPLECLVKTEVVRDTPQAIHLIVARSIRCGAIRMNRPTPPAART
ncbi:MAG: hypothetical protein LAN70_02465 [Acidobacteriia bacterium]|nr:hypothetical protein [Terriglobia bacterium]